MEYATRAIREPLRRRTVDSSASFCSVLQTLRNDAIESIVRRRSGSQIARVARAMRTPKIVLAWCARRVRFASRCGVG
eukprot:3215588-Lingulodinium_polyedra.AAC.1